MSNQSICTGHIPLCGTILENNFFKIVLSSQWLRFSSRLLLSVCFWIIIASQTFQQLSYANAELGQHLIRPTHTTPPNTFDIHFTVPTTQTEAPTTPKSTGFFSGLRNLFSRNSGTTTTVRPQKLTTTPQSSYGPVSNTPIVSFPQPNIVPASPSLNVRTRNGGSNLPVRTISSIPPTTTTTSKPYHNDEFPALSPPRRNDNNRPVSQRPGTANSPPDHDWSNHGNFNQGSHHSTPQNVWSNIGHRGGSLPNLSATTTHRPSYSLPTSKSMTNIHSGGHSNNNNNHRNNNNNLNTETPLATDAEIEALTESLFEKSSPNIFPSIHVNLQGRTRSSEQSDQAPMP